MSAPAVDDVLGALAEVAGESVAQWRAADGDARELALELTDVPEPAGMPEVPPDPHDQAWPDPRRSFQLLQQDLNRAAAKAVARAFVAWWADVATVAVMDALTQKPVDRTRAIAGDPRHRLRGEALAHYEEFTSSPFWFDAADPGERRSHLWGDDWIDAGAPRLATAADLSETLRTYGVSATLVEQVRQARESVAEAVASAAGGGRPEQAGVRAGPDPDRRSIEALTNYARLLTTILPAIRAIRESGS